MKRQRPGAPKKPYKDKVSPLTITVKNSTIDRMGGKKACLTLLKLEAERW